MKKLLFIIACSLQFVNAQTKPETGEYLSEDKTSSGVNLFLNDDKTFQMFVLNGTYEIKNDSIVFENNSTNASKSTFKVQFTKSKTANKKVTIFIEPIYPYSRPTFFLGIQNNADGEIIYKSINEYFEEDEIANYYEHDYLDKKEGESNKMSFELYKPYAIYTVEQKETKAKIEKYLISSDVSEIKIESNNNVFDDIKLSATIGDTNTLTVFINKSSPLKFVNKKAKIESKNEIPATKITEKNWTYPGKKDYNDFSDDSTAVVVDTAMAYSDTDSNYEFKAKVERNLKEALVNIKKDPAKYLIVYYNLKGKRTEKDFKNFIEEYNVNISNTMYSEYDAAYDKYNFYLATKSDEAFLKKNNAKDKSILILNKDGKIIASSTKSLNQIANTLNYDSENILNKLLETENAIALSNSITNKKTSIQELTKNLNSNYRDFYANKYYYDYAYSSVDTAAVVDYPIEEEENEVIVAEAAAVVAVDSAAAYENNDFTYYKTEISQKLLAEKLNTIFEYYNSRNIVNNDLVNILLGEISGNHTTFDLFKNENNTNNKQEIKYMNYILKYNENKKNKVKIATILSDMIYEKKSNNPDITTYNTIADKLISYSNNNFGIIQSAVFNYNANEQGSEKANKLVDLLYNTLVNDKPIFENMDAQFNNLDTEAELTMDWSSFKSRINTMLNAQAWDIFETKKTQDFERAIKWSELSNIVEKENPYSLDTLGQLYFAVGKKSEAITIQTKAVAIAKATNINHEEFEKALINMKK